MNYLDLALRYGGFTSLDKVYLTNKLATLSDADKLTFITPPPSVINAYFAELYQKESPQAATAYFFDLSKHLNLFNDQPSFDEVKPFIRLNLAGQSYGLAYENDREVAQVFAEVEAPITAHLLFEVAQLFPHYQLFQVGSIIKMEPLSFEECESQRLENDSALLTEIVRLKDGTIKISSFNQEELLEVAKAYKGQRYYNYSQRQHILYITV